MHLSHASRRRPAPLLLGALMSLTAASSAAASETNANGTAAGCAAQFEAAQRLDMESFRDYDAETFRAVHDPRAVTVFASGAVRFGIDAIMTALSSHFARRGRRSAAVRSAEASPPRMPSPAVYAAMSCGMPPFCVSWKSLPTLFRSKNQAALQDAIMR